MAAELVGAVRDLVARLGGDEFGVLLQAPAPVRRTRGPAHGRGDRRLDDSAVTVSIGVATGPMSGVLATLWAADSAMYVAKRAGGNRAHRFEPAA